MQAIESRFNQKLRVPPMVSDQSWLLAMLAGAAFIVAMVIVFVTNFFRDIEISAWEVVGSIAPWYVAVMAGWITFTLAPMYVAHGKTRQFVFREWLTTGAFMTVIGAVLMTLGYLLEHMIYNIANFAGRTSPENFFDSATDVPMMMLQYLLHFAVWFVLGGFVGISLYKSDDVGWISIPIAIALAAAAGTLGYSSSGFMGIVRRVIPAIDVDSLWLQVPILLAVLVFGVLITRKILSDISLRNP